MLGTNCRNQSIIVLFLRDGRGSDRGSASGYDRENGHEIHDGCVHEIHHDCVHELQEIKLRDSKQKIWQRYHF